MKVFMVRYDVKDYQQLFYSDPTMDVAFFNFYGDSLQRDWRIPKNIFVSNPMEQKGDFRAMGEILLLEKSKAILAPILDPVSEYYEFIFEGEKHSFFNVTYFCDCLDKNKSTIEWEHRKDGASFIGEIHTHVFRTDRLPKHSVFRLPGPVVSTELYTIEGCFKDKNKEFKYVVEKNNLKGLKFKLVWDSEAEG